MTALVKLLSWIITKYELKWHYSVDEANFLLLLQPITQGHVHAQPSYKYTWIYMYSVQTVNNQGCNKG